MGNEFTGEDMAPHQVYPLTMPLVMDPTTAATFQVMEAGHHGKLRLRYAMVQVVDANLDATVVLSVKHGGNTAATITMGADVLGTAKALTIDPAYQDADEDDEISYHTDGDCTTGDVLITAVYELIA